VRRALAQDAHAVVSFPRGYAQLRSDAVNRFGSGVRSKAPCPIELSDFERVHGELESLIEPIALGWREPPSKFGMECPRQLGVLGFLRRVQLE